MAVSTVGDIAAKQTKGIPMGFSVSVILLNIYMFTYEFKFVQRMKLNAPDLLSSTFEFFRYVDDLCNLSDLDLRPYLIPIKEEPSDWNWTYPMAPWGPLTITDQTERITGYTTVVYLNMRFTHCQGMLSYMWHAKADIYRDLNLLFNSYTHWALPWEEAAN
jgi:hypothetical protein